MRDGLMDPQSIDDRIALQRARHVATRILLDDAPLDGRRLLLVGEPRAIVLDAFRRLGLDVHSAVDVDGLPVLAYHAGTFDFVYADSVLEQVTASGALLREMSRVLRVAGRAVVITPGARTDARGGAHVRTFTRRALRDAMVIHGFDWVACYRFSAGRSALAASWSRWIAALPDWLNDVVPSPNRSIPDDGCLIAFGRKPSTTRVEFAAPPTGSWLLGAETLAAWGSRSLTAEACR